MDEEPPKGLTVVRHEPDTDAYRSPGRAKGRVEFEWRWFQPTAYRKAVVGLVLLAIDVLLVLLFRYFIVEMEVWGPVVVLGLVVGLPLGGAHVAAIQYATSRTKLVASPEGLTITWGPIWGSERTLPLEAIGQLFVAEEKGRAAILNHVIGNDPEVVARQLEPEHARFIEREIERTLGLTDRAVEGELPRGPELKAALRRSPTRPLAVACVALAVIGVAGYFLAQPAERTAGVSLLSGPAELDFEAEAGETYSFWTVTRATSDRPNTGEPRVDDLEGTATIHIELRRNRDSEAPVATLHCDPFGGSYFEWTSTESALTETEYSFVGRMDGCSARFPAGGPVHARATVGDVAEQVRFSRLELLVR